MPDSPISVPPPLFPKIIADRESEVGLPAFRAEGNRTNLPGGENLLPNRPIAEDIAKVLAFQLDVRICRVIGGVCGPSYNEWTEIDLFGRLFAFRHADTNDWQGKTAEEEIANEARIVRERHHGIDCLHAQLATKCQLKKELRESCRGNIIPEFGANLWNSLSQRHATREAGLSSGFAEATTGVVLDADFDGIVICQHQLVDAVANLCGPGSTQAPFSSCPAEGG
ncbi:hypothetical protein PMIN06_001720 [Paraphaeosphaeria minitans]